MVVITAVDVTYDNALGPTGYHRVTDGSGNAVEWTPSTYLWYKPDRTSHSNGITSFSIVFDLQFVPDGYIAIEKNLTPKSPDNSCAYICYQVDPTENDPIETVRIVKSKSEVPIGFSVVELPHSQHILCYSRVEEFTIGDSIDYFAEQVGVWKIATILDVKSSEIQVKYCTSRDSNATICWVQRNSDRLAPASTHTASRQNVWHLTREQLEIETSRLAQFDSGELKNIELEGNTVDYWTKYLPKMVHKCLTTQLSPDCNAMPQLNMFLQAVLACAVQVLRDPATALHVDATCVLLSFILNGNKKAMPYYTRPIKNLDDSLEYNLMFTQYDRKKTDMSVYFVLNLDHFGQCNGYEVILNTKATLAQLEVYSWIVVHGFRYFKQSFRAEFVPLYIKIALERIIDVSDIELRDEFVRIDRNLVVLDQLMERVDATHRMDRFYFDLCIRYLNSDCLAPRLTGMNRLAELLRSVPTPAKTARPSQWRSMRHTSARTVVEWLVEVNIVCLLNDASVIKAAQAVLEVLAQYNRISEQDIRHLWSTTESSATLIHLIPFLTPERLRTVGSCLEQADTLNVQLIQKYALADSHNGLLLGLMLLWEKIENPEAQTAFCALFQRSDQYVAEFVERCVDNLRRGTCICPSLRVLRTILKVSGQTTATTLIKSYDLVALVVDDLRTLTAVSVDPEAIENIQTSLCSSLIFLEFLVIRSSLTRRQFEQLWDCFTSTKESDVFFRWLIQMKSHLSPQVVDDMFQTRLTDCSNFTLTALECFQTYGAANQNIMLWQIAMTAIDGQVSERAISILTRYSNIRHGLYDCLDRLETALSSTEMERLVCILATFISHLDHASPDGLRITVAYLSSELIYRLLPSCPIRELRERVSLDINRSCWQIRLLDDQNKTMRDEMLLKEVKTQSFCVEILKKPAADTTPLKTEASLEQNQSFLKQSIAPRAIPVLNRLLEQNFTQPIVLWKLLNILGQKIEATELDQSNPIKLYYQLDSTAVTVESVTRVVQILNLDLFFNGPFEQECLAKLLSFQPIEAADRVVEILIKAIQVGEKQGIFQKGLRILLAKEVVVPLTNELQQILRYSIQQGRLKPDACVHKKQDWIIPMLENWTTDEPNQFYFEFYQEFQVDSIPTILRLMQQFPSQQVLMGSLDLLSNESSLDASTEFVDFFLDTVVFGTPDQLPRARSAKARELCFQLLKKLATPHKHRIAQLLTQMHSSYLETTLPMTATAERIRLKTIDYVGLKNLGCTCYLNSILHAFFLIPEFRQLVLATTVSDNGLLFEFQLVFGHLLRSNGSYYDPSRLIKALEINPTQQQDASECLTAILQRFETIWNGTESERQLKEMLGGEFSNELVVTEPESKYSERVEPFYFISVPVSKTLAQAFDQWIEPESVSYRWDSNTAPIATQKKISIRTAPQYLFVHLKRFAFNGETIAKVHTHMSFPLLFDLTPYTKTIDRRLMYDLIGVVVHVGTAQSGHYVFYSKTQTDDWYECNDTDVSSCDPDQLGRYCFGGSRKSPSAFLLVYKQQQQEEPKSVIPCTLPDPIQKIVSKSNSIQWKREYLSQVLYLEFLQEFVSKDSDPKLVLALLSDSSVRSDWMIPIGCQALERSKDAAVWWVDQLIQYTNVFDGFVETDSIGLGKLLSQLDATQCQDIWTRYLVQMSPSKAPIDLLGVLCEAHPSLAMDHRDFLTQAVVSQNKRIDILKHVISKDVSDQMLLFLVQRPSVYSNEREIVLKDLYQRVCFENLNHSEKMLTMIANGIETEQFDSLKRYFRAFILLASIEDSYQSIRISDGMTSILAIMASQQKYFKCTITSLEMLLRSIRTNPLIQDWLKRNSPNWTWISDWLRNHRGKSGYLQSGVTKWNKPTSQGGKPSSSVASWDRVNPNSTEAIAFIMKSVDNLLSRLEKNQDGYDSDCDPQEIVGRRIKVKWAREKWYSGQVTRFDQDREQHLVVYDDGDEKWYRLSEKTFSFHL